VSVTWNVHTGSVTSVALTGWKPESIPVGDRTHGAAKVDWVTEWFLFWLWRDVRLSMIEPIDEKRATHN